MKSSARLLVVLLAMTVLLAALLAFEAQRATRSHRVTAERALRDYASVAAWEFASASRDLLDRRVTERFGRVVGSPAASPYDSLPPPSVLAVEASSFAPLSFYRVEPNSLRCGFEEWLAGDERHTAFEPNACLGARRDSRQDLWFRAALAGHGRSRVGGRGRAGVGPGLRSEVGAIQWVRHA